jgi:hypothetical protein
MMVWVKLLQQMKNFVQDFGQKASFIVWFLCHFHKSGDGLV